MTPGELDSLLERAAELQPHEQVTDPLELRRWADRATTLLIDLREALRTNVVSHGGTFALRLREALEAQLLKQVNGRAELTTETTEHTVTVHLVPDEVIVDVRLRVGKERENAGALELEGNRAR